MVMGSVMGGLAGGASVSIVINAVNNFSKTFALVNTQLVALGGGAVIAGGLIAGGMVTAGKAAAGVETEYAKVNTLLEKGQDAQKLYGKAVQDTNVKLGNQGNQVDALKAIYQIQSAGITDVAKSQLFLDKATTSSVGGSANLETVITAGTKTMSAFGLGVEDSGRIFDVFAGTVKAGQTTMQQLASAFPTVAGIAGEMGVSLEETAGTFAGLTKFMGSAEEATTSMSAILRSFLKPTTDMSAAVEALGYDSAASMIEQEGLNGALKMLSDSVDGDTTAMGKLFPNVRALKAVLPLTGKAANDVSTSIDTVTDSAGLSEKQFADMTDTVQYQWGAAMSAARNVVIDIGDTINTVFAPAMKFMMSLIKKVSDFWLDLPTPIKKAVVMITAAATAILIIGGGIAILIGLKAGIVLLFITITPLIWTAVTASLALVAANIWWIAIVALVIAAIAGLIAIIKYLWKHWDDMSAKMKIVIGIFFPMIAVGILLIKHWDDIKAALKALGDFFIEIFEMQKQLIIDTWTFITNFIKSGVEKIKEAWEILKTALTKLSDFFKAIWDYITDNIKDKIAVMMALWDILKQALVDLSTYFKNIFEGIAKIIAKVWDFIITIITNAVLNIMKVWEALKQSLINVGEMFKNVFKGIANIVITTWSFIITAIENSINSIIGLVNKVISKINKISVDIPDWVPKYGGETFGFDINKLSDVSLDKFKGSKLSYGDTTESPTSVTVNIDTVNGADVDDLTEALQKELTNIIRLN